MKSLTFPLLQLTSAVFVVVTCIQYKFPYPFAKLSFNNFPSHENMHTDVHF